MPEPVTVSILITAQACTLVGTVTDAEGRPLAEVCVTCRDLAGAPMAWTGQDGRYELHGFGPGRHDVDFHPPGNLVATLRESSVGATSGGHSDAEGPGVQPLIVRVDIVL
jgi:hypothetical protein